MIKTVLFITRRSFSFLLKNPRYFLLGMIFTVGNWFPIPIQWETLNQADPSITENPLVKEFFSHFASPSNALLFISFIILLFWILKMTLLSLLYLDIYFKKKDKEKKPLLKMMSTILISLPSIILLHLLLILSLFVLFLFLGLPVASLLSAGSFYASGFLGTLAVIVFLSTSVIAFALFLFSHFFILFSRLSLKNALGISARLYQKKKKVSILFLLFFLILFLLLQALIALLPGFYLSENSLVPFYAQLPIIVNLMGFVISFLLLSLYLSLFPIASVFFFLHIAKQPPQKKEVLKATESALTPLLKKESETL